MKIQKTLSSYKFCYNYFALPFFWSALRIAGLFNAKIKKGIDGRKNLLKKIAQQAAALPAAPRIWFHVSSMGEFEQAKPIIASLKTEHPGCQIIVTFFSPSGYEHSRSYRAASIICYLPFDTHSNIVRFLDIIRPKIAVMVRYDIWPNVVWELHHRSIPVCIVNATMRHSTPRKLPIVRSFHRELYESISRILTVSENDRISFGDFQISGTVIETAGDTRFDQVIQRSAEARKKHLLSVPVYAKKQVVVIGQSWDADEEIVLPPIQKMLRERNNLLAIIVPHEPTEETLALLEAAVEPPIRTLRLSLVNDYNGEEIIIGDSVGIMVALYQYAHIAYVGGSFKQGIHNVLEPAAFGIPVLYGPKHTNSQEAVAMEKLGAGFVTATSEQFLETALGFLDDEERRMKAGCIAAAFVREHAGATKKCVDYILPMVKAIPQQG